MKTNALIVVKNLQRNAAAPRVVPAASCCPPHRATARTQGPNVPRLSSGLPPPRLAIKLRTKEQTVTCPNSFVYVTPFPSKLRVILAKYFKGDA